MRPVDGSRRPVPNGAGKRPRFRLVEMPDQRIGASSRTLSESAGAGRGGPRTRLDSEPPVQAPNDRGQGIGRVSGRLQGARNENAGRAQTRQERATRIRLD